MELVQKIEKALVNKNIDLARQLHQELIREGKDRDLVHSLGNVIQRAICEAYMDENGLL